MARPQPFAKDAGGGSHFVNIVSRGPRERRRQAGHGGWRLYISTADAAE